MLGRENIGRRTRVSSKKKQSPAKAGDMVGQIDRLCAEIEEHNYRYHVLDDPVVLALTHTWQKNKKNKKKASE